MTSIRPAAVLILTLSMVPTTAFAIDPHEPDDTPGFQLTLAGHGSLQAHDLEGTADVDYVLVDGAPRRSYEASLATLRFFPVLLTRRNSEDVELQAATPMTINSNRSATGSLQGALAHSSRLMNWIESGDVASRTRFLRVDSNDTPLTVTSQYTLGLRETTLYCPRYNNTGGQVTVLVVQNAGPQETFENTNGCAWVADFYDGAHNAGGHALNGSFLGSTSSGTSLAYNGVAVVPAAAVAPGTSGSIQIAHTCGYGKVQAKAVSLEPATGFTFDTTCSPRPE
jgi:hypothetical protein